jgi:UPF0716 family protein affecting phage T7 exclusion
MPTYGGNVVDAMVNGQEGAIRTAYRDFAIASLLFIAPGWQTGLAGLLVAAPAVATQFIRWRLPTK